MTDTARTLAQIKTLLADNATGAISPHRTHDPAPSYQVGWDGWVGTPNFNYALGMAVETQPVSKMRFSAPQSAVITHRSSIYTITDQMCAAGNVAVGWELTQDSGTNRSVKLVQALAVRIDGR